MWAKPSQPSLYRYIFTSNATWIVPSNVKSAYVSIAGGGAAGVSDYPATGTTAVAMVSGSAGGFLSSYPLNLTPGESIMITIGVGGVPGVANAGQLAGSASKFGSYLTCSGGINWALPGSCGSQGGNGFWGLYVNSRGGVIPGGQTPLGYGSGGVVTRCDGCAGTYPTSGGDGSPGVVIVDVLY